MLKWIAPVLLCATSVFAQEYPTAYQALRVVGKQLNRDYVNRVISINGINGTPQPETWRVMLADASAPGGVREVTVRNGQISSNRAGGSSVVGTTKGATINVAKLNLDSSGAYSAASRTAENSHTVFSGASYTLRTDDRGNPTWVVTLQNGAQPVGTIYIGANVGTVTRTEGMFQGTNMRDVVQQRSDRSDPDVYAGTEPVDPDEADENPIKRNLKRVIKRAFRRARDDTKQGFQDLRRSFEDYFNGR